MVKYYVYIIYSETLDRYYVGYSEDVMIRLTQHNTGQSTYTAKAIDWVLRYKEVFEDRLSAHKRELEIKKKKSRKYLEWLISNP